MAKSSNTSIERRSAFSLQFNLLSLVIFSVALILSSGGLVYLLTGILSTKSDVRTGLAPARETQMKGQFDEDIPPWGELVTYDMEIEHLDEFAMFNYAKDQKPTWVFSGMPAEENVRDLMTRCGLSAAQIEQAFSASSVSRTPSNIVIRPDADLILSLTPEVRGNLYAELGRNPANFYMHFPACLLGNPVELAMYQSKLDPKMIALIKSLLFQRDGVTFFSDFELVLARATSAEERNAIMKALTREPGVVARLRIRPTTDVDKLLGYWTQTPGVRLRDLRPLLESIKRLPNGDTISLLYLLPPFVRERLYTFPLPSQVGDPAMDCHWASLNFFSEQPDPRLGDPAYAAKRLLNDYYPIQRPGKYGDIVVLLDPDGNGIHSAVYIADDIVFTKNGNNPHQPFMLMRLNNLVAKYSIRGTPRVAIYRDRDS